MERSPEIDAALDRLQHAGRIADHKAWDAVAIKTDDLLVALRELDRAGVIVLDLGDIPR